MDVKNLFLGSLSETINITLIILVLMIVIEFLVLKYEKQLLKFFSKNKFWSYPLASFFGIIPGCIGTFAMDTFYMAGLLGFGGLMSTMIATSGDESFIMISMMMAGEISFNSVILLLVSLFILGIFGGLLTNYLKKKFKISVSKKCEVVNHHKKEFSLKHFLKEHIFHHIIKKHIWKLFLWIFVAIFLIGFVSEFIDVSSVFANTNPFFLLLIAGLVGLLPISGPNTFLLVLFSKSLIPFSVLLTNSIIQDGHGLLPIIGFSVDDAIKLKIINFFFGMIVGTVLILIGF